MAHVEARIWLYLQILTLAPTLLWAWRAGITQFHYSIDGWLVVSNWDWWFFFNPFTREKTNICLETYYSAGLAVASSPTCGDCRVFFYIRGWLWWRGYRIVSSWWRCCYLSKLQVRSSLWAVLFKSSLSPWFILMFRALWKPWCLWSRSQHIDCEWPVTPIWSINKSALELFVWLLAVITDEFEKPLEFTDWIHPMTGGRSDRIILEIRRNSLEKKLLSSFLQLKGGSLTRYMPESIVESIVMWY